MHIERCDIMLDETWRPVEGYEGLYEVSSLGRIKSLERYSKEFMNRGTLCRRRVPERIMKGTPDPDGYLDVALTDQEGKQKYYRVNRIVAQAFKPNPDNLPQVDHLNGIKDDNRAENLEWVSCKENIQRAWRDGRCSPPPVTPDKIERFRNLGKRMAEWRGSPCRCVEDGLTFFTIEQAAKYYSISSNSLWERLKTNNSHCNKSCRGLHFEYISKDSEEYKNMLDEFRSSLDM